MKLIKIRNLCKNYHTSTKEIKVLNNISFDINNNEIVSIVGPSGCGKSTLLNILAKLDSKYSGSITKSNDLKIGYMMQDDALLPWLNVWQNATLGLKLSSSLTKENEEYVIYLLKKYELYDFIFEYPNNLSGGMRQRLALIRTLAIKPNILFLDEPFSKLDYKTRISITDDVYKIIKELNISAILITHDIKEAVIMSNRIIILEKRPATIKDIVKIDVNDLLPSQKELDLDTLKNIKSIMELTNDYV